jgi:hypothetical protein
MIRAPARTAIEAARLKSGEFGIQANAESGVVDPPEDPQMVPMVDQNTLYDETATWPRHLKPPGPASAHRQLDL